MRTIEIQKQSTPPAPLILCLESVAGSASAAVFKGATLLACSEVHSNRNQALANLVQQVTANCGLNTSDFSAVAVSNGPGSYTGLRIGYSTAKGLCFAHNIPLIDLPTLPATASAGLFFTAPGKLICPMLDARRMEVYTALYRHEPDHSLTELLPVHALVLSEDSLVEELEKNVIFFIGDGSFKCKGLFEGKPYAANARVIEGIVPSARYMGGIALQKFQANDFADLAYSEPFYLKEANTGGN